MSFSEALKALEAGQVDTPSRMVVAGKPRSVAREATPARPDGWPAFAEGLISEAESVLWSSRGAEARDYLLGRGLSEETIWSARLGFQPEETWIGGIFEGRRIWVPSGIVIPWFDASTVALVNVRRFDGDPRYIAIRGSRRGGVYPSLSEVVTGKPVVIVEGELDALLLRQELAGLAAVITLGGASSRPSLQILSRLIAAHPWIIATDADDAGDKAAGDWLERSDRAIRVRPPEPYGKDWTEVHQSGLDLKAWWVGPLEGKAPGSIDQSKPAPIRPSQTREHPPAPSVDRFPAAFTEVPGPPPSSDLDGLAWWSDEWRLRWSIVHPVFCKFART